MLKLRWMAAMVVAVLVLALAGQMSVAQDAAKPKEEGAAREGGGGGGEGGGRGERGGRGGGGPGGPGGGGGDFRAQMETRMKEALGANDDEWKLLQPKIEKVMTAQGQLRGGGFGGRGMGGGRGPGGGGPGGGGDRPQSEMSKASEDLRKTLEDKTSSNDTIKSKLAAVRKARETARADLTKAQQDLRDILSLRQEAQLVSFGMLD